MSYEHIKILPDIDGEGNDFPKKFKNIDNEIFEFSWDGLPYSVKAGEIVSFPKYLVNYAANHLARKIVKREAIEAAAATGISLNKDLGNAIRITDENKQLGIMKKCVAVNFPGELYPGEEADIEKMPIAEEPAEDKFVEKQGLTCEECGFTAKTEFGLKSHIRSHKKK